MGTRIQDKSRPTKRPMADVTYDVNGSVTTVDRVNARIPRHDKRGYPGTPAGLPAPVLVKLTTVDTT